MIFRRPWLVLWLLGKCGGRERIAASKHRVFHAAWINGLNFLLTFGPLLALIRLWLGPPGGWLRVLLIVVVASLFYGVAAARAEQSTGSPS